MGELDAWSLRALRILSEAPAWQDRRFPLRSTVPLIQGGYVRVVDLGHTYDQRLEITRLGLAHLEKHAA